LRVAKIETGHRRSAAAVIAALWLFAWATADAADARRDGAAVRHLKEQAARGNAAAQAKLGFMYANGFGVPQSYDAAVALYVDSAERGDPTGQYLLGLMYDKGFGVGQNVILAYKWLNLAAAGASTRQRDYYIRLRDAVASKMTRAQLDEGQDRSISWSPKPR
jgi:TPR repeat protein